MRQPVAQTVGVTFIYLRDSDIDVEALVDFLLAVVGGEDDANSKDIIDFIEGDVLVLHLVPNGVGRLDALFDVVFYAHLVQRLLNRCSELIEEFVARGFGTCQF